MAFETREAALLTRREALRRAAYLMGGAISAPTLTAVLAGCERGGETAAVAAGLPPARKEMVATVAEHILPQTDTPGARAVGVHDFIDLMMAEYYPENEKAVFLAGLDDVDARARAAHGSDFMECTAAQQAAILAALDRETFAPRPARPEPERIPDIRDVTEPGAGETPLPPELESDSIRWIWGEPGAGQPKAEVPFWRTMKELTLVGYYTSEPGATEELRYEQVPGRYEGCIPFSRVGRTWAV